SLFGGVFARSSDPNARKPRDAYGYLSEIDPALPPSSFYNDAHRGHRKIGALGRARWENTTFKTILSKTGHWILEPDAPITFYAGNDRRGGRVYKFVSAKPYKTGMTPEQARALLDEGTVYVAHFADLNNADGRTACPGGGTCANAALPTRTSPAKGVWIALRLDNTTQVAPNAGARTGMPADTRVGAALKDNHWNNLGGFDSKDTLLKALFTASMKLGIRELNRPEDVEWNPVRNELMIAFTKHGKRVGLTDRGLTQRKEEQRDIVRTDPAGSIMGLREGENHHFTFWVDWSASARDAEGHIAKGHDGVAAPDNLLIDAQGGVWFGTDGNFSRNGTADGLYYLDLDPTHASGQPGITRPTYGRAFRVAATPSDAEATGPSFTPDMTTLFTSVQHPGERDKRLGVPGELVSRWPQER
ncbi:MAG: alkaline phosphatase PhoX, partial [Myxococcota bacterium]